MKLSRRTLLASGAALVLAPALAQAAKAQAKPKPLVLNDAGRLSPTSVAKHIVIKPNEDEAIFAELRALLKDAAEENRTIAMGGARHSMGGQSLPRDGTAITLDGGPLEMDTAAKTYRTSAGNRWSDVIRILDPKGFSPAVMQSNSDFGQLVSHLPMRGSSRPSRTSATNSRPTPQLCRNGLAARLRCRPTSPSDIASAGPLPGSCFSSVHSLLSEVH